MKFQLLICLVILGSAMASQEVQKCILDSTTSDIFGEINEIRAQCGQNSCMQWFNNRQIDQTLSVEEIKECFQICAQNSESSFVSKFINEVIVKGCVLSEQLQEEFEVVSDEQYKPKLRSSNKQTQQKESSMISKFISSLWGGAKTEEKSEEQTIQNYGSWGSWGSWDSEYYYGSWGSWGSWDSEYYYGSWGSWGSWDSEYYYYIPYATLANEFSNSAGTTGKIDKKTTSQFLLDGEDFGSVVQYEVKDHWNVDSSFQDQSYGSINLWFDSYSTYYGSLWGSSWPILYEDLDYEVEVKGEVTHKKVYTLEEQDENKSIKQKMAAKGLKIPDELKKSDFGSNYEVTEVNDVWEWDLNKDGDVDLQIEFPLYGSAFGSLFGSLF